MAPLFRFRRMRRRSPLPNDTEFGLLPCFFSRGISAGLAYGRAVEYGIVGITLGIISTEVAPFGGVKAFAMAARARNYGIEDLLEIKISCMWAGSRTGSPPFRPRVGRGEVFVGLFPRKRESGAACSDLAGRRIPAFAGMTNMSGGALFARSPQRQFSLIG